MKALNRTWKEIGEVLPGKTMENIKKKYKELYIDAPANVKPKEVAAKKEETKKETVDNEEGKKEEKQEEKKEDAKKDEGKAAEESKTGSGGGKKGGKDGTQGKKGQKGQKGQKGKQTAEEAKPKEAEVEEAKSEGKRGALKAKATVEEKGKGGELKSINGHPVIFVDDDEELEFEEVSLGAMRSFVGLRPILL